MKRLLIIGLLVLVSACTQGTYVQQPPVIGGDTEMSCKTVITERRESVTCKGEDVMTKSRAIEAARGARLRNRIADIERGRNSRRRHKNSIWLFGGIMEIRPK